jgi:hypothetical protein
MWKLTVVSLSRTVKAVTFPVTTERDVVSALARVYVEGKESRVEKVGADVR